MHLHLSAVQELLGGRCEPFLDKCHLHSAPLVTADVEAPIRVIPRLHHGVCSRGLIYMSYCRLQRLMSSLAYKTVQVLIRAYMMADSRCMTTGGACI